MMEHWDLWQDTAHSPSFNMAADELLLETAIGRGRPLLRFYTWDRRAVSIGYFQTCSAAPEGFAFVRRPTGGGVVYHDYDFTYTVVFPAEHWLNGLDRNESYDWINRAVQSALDGLDIHASLAQNQIPHDVDRLTMVCFTNPTRYDVLLDNAKIAGSAQRRTADGILHQGSIHFGRPLPVLRENLASAMQEAFRSVMEVDFASFVPEEDFIKKVEDKVEAKYGTEAWNNRR